MTRSRVPPVSAHSPPCLNGARRPHRHVSPDTRLRPFDMFRRIPASQPKGASMNVSMTVNGRSVSEEVEPRTLLVHFIRENLQLTGTHVGCETGYCGACTVHVDGKAVKSCTMFAVQADGTEVMTIEKLASNNELHPVQKSF